MEPAAAAGEPCNFEDWSVWRNFHEAGRLMTTYFQVFRYAVVYLLFPGSLIAVVCFQFLIDLYPPDAPFAALSFILYSTGTIWSMELMRAASNLVLASLKTTIYALDGAKFQNGESPQFLVDLLCPCQSESKVGGRRPRALGVGVLCVLTFCMCFSAPILFGFKGVVAVGMPAWTAFLFTPPLVAGETLVILYLVLVVDLVVRLWMYAGADERVDLDMKTASSRIFVA